jgi:hypothetical protein
MFFILDPKPKVQFWVEFSWHSDSDIIDILSGISDQPQECGLPNSGITNAMSGGTT